MTPKEIFQTIKDKDVKFVDLRFTDTRGKEQHVSVPVKAFGQDKFESGHFFDGSSIAGWKGIQASDMVLLPDPTSSFIDPFLEQTTLAITCDVIEPSDGKGYDRDPRSIAKRGAEYLKSTGLGDTAFFGPEPEFFIFDAVEWSVDMSGSRVQDLLGGSAWTTGETFAAGNKGHRPAVKGGYFPVPPVDSLQNIRSAICTALEADGRCRRSAPSRSGNGRPERNRHEVRSTGSARRLDDAFEVCGPQRRRQVRQDRDLHAEADRRRQRFRYARASVDLERRDRTCSRAMDMRVSPNSRSTTSAASSNMPRP